MVVRGASVADAVESGLELEISLDRGHDPRADVSTWGLAQGLNKGIFQRLL